MRALVVTSASGRINAKTTLVGDHRVVPCLKSRTQRCRIGSPTSKVGDCVRIHDRFTSGGTRTACLQTLIELFCPAQLYVSHLQQWPLQVEPSGWTDCYRFTNGLWNRRCRCRKALARTPATHKGDRCDSHFRHRPYKEGRPTMDLRTAPWPCARALGRTRYRST